MSDLPDDIAMEITHGLDTLTLYTETMCYERKDRGVILYGCKYSKDIAKTIKDWMK